MKYLVKCENAVTEIVSLRYQMQENEKELKTLNFEVKRLRLSVTQGEAAVYCNGVKLVQFGDKIERDGKHGDLIGHWGSTISDEEFITATLFPNEIRRNYYPQEVNAIFDKIKAIIANQ